MEIRVIRTIVAKHEAKLEGKLERDTELLENAQKAFAEGIPSELIQKITGFDMDVLRK